MVDPLAPHRYEVIHSNDARVKNESYKSNAAHGPLGDEKVHGEQNPFGGKSLHTRYERPISLGTLKGNSSLV